MHFGIALVRNNALWWIADIDVIPPRLDSSFHNRLFFNIIQ